VIKSVPKSDLVAAMNYITIPAVLGRCWPAVGGFIVTYFLAVNLLSQPAIGLAGSPARAYIPDIKPKRCRGLIRVGSC